MSQVLKRRGIAVAAVLVVLLIGDIIATPILGDDRTDCERAAEWAVAHKDFLPTTLEELSAFPTSYRRAIADALAPEVTAELWRAHTTQLAQRSNISQAQREATLEMASLIAPVLYDRNPALDSSRQQLREELTRRLVAAYPHQEDRVEFSTLGPTEAPFSLDRGSYIQLRDGIRSLFVADARRFVNCNCSTWFDCNQSALSCDYGNCTQVYQCGPFGGQPCYGRCIYP